MKKINVRGFLQEIYPDVFSLPFKRAASTPGAQRASGLPPTLKFSKARGEK